MKNKFLLVTAIIFTLNGCATNPNDGMMARIYSYVPAETKSEVKRTSPASFQNIVNSGYQKLSLDDLFTLNHYKIKVIETSRENCMVMLDDKSISSSKKELALATLPPADYDQYAKIFAKTISLGVNDGIRAPSRINKDEFNKALNTALDGSIAGPLPKYLAIVADPMQDQCGIIYKGLSYADQKRNKISEIIVRYMGI